MSDYRNPNDPMGRDPNPLYDPDDRGGSATWGWAAAALFVVVILAIAFGVGSGPSRVASNNASPPVMSPAAPGAANPGNPAPLAPPSAPASQNNNNP
jgi:hypothetical protein